MENNTDKEKWIGRVLDSTSGMSQAQPESGTYERISTKLNGAVPDRAITVTKPAKQWMAAAAILLALNVGSILYFTAYNHKPRQTNTADQGLTEIQSVTTYNY